MKEKRVPGTTMPYAGEEGMFALFRPLIKATNGLTLGQVCAVTGLEPSTVQNWIKRGFVARPVEKKYFERQLARILLISALRDSMRIEQIGALMARVNGDANSESDDIITEEALYDHLCELIRRRDEEATPLEAVPELVCQVTRDYSPPTPDAANRLRAALTVMVYAYTAGEYKREAERCFYAMGENP